MTASARPAKPHRPPLAPLPQLCDDRTLLRAALLLGAVLFLWKLWVAAISHVIWEEGHFVVSGQHLAAGYPDIPAGFPWLARLITTLFGWHVLPLRFVALLISMCAAPAVWFMARPITTQRNALWAAICALLLPPISLNGTIFYPEGALQVLLALMLGCLLRAVQASNGQASDRQVSDAQGPARLWWSLAGLCAAVGLLVHFRFLIPGLAVVFFLIANADGRRQWLRPGIWITAGIGALGLVPSLIYNASHDWPAIAFHVVNRPSLDLDLKHIVDFLLTQMVVVTPAFAAALIVAARRALARDSSSGEQLLGYQAAVLFLFYGLQAVINKQVMPHWPFMAYLPLLPFIPGIAIAFAGRASSLVGRWSGTAVIAAGPFLALCLGLAISAYEYAYVHSAELPYHVRQFNLLKNEDWTRLEPALAAADARARARFGGDPAWVALGHLSAVRIEFPAMPGRSLYTLDEPYDVKARFVVARHEWGRDRAALMRDQVGKGVVIALTEPTDLYRESARVQMYADLCQSLDGIERAGTVTLPPGRTEINLFTARVRAKPLPGLPSQPCALLPQVSIGQPARGRFLKPETQRTFFGLAADPVGITKVEVLLDGKLAAHTRYGLAPEGVRAPDVLRYDPNWPKVRYAFSFPPGALVPGEHVLSIHATRTDGTVLESDPRTLYVK